MFAKRLFQKATHHLSQHNAGSCLASSELDLRISVHYGIPSTASILAFDPIQRLLAIGTLDGRIKVIGGDNIEALLVSPQQLPYKYLEFLQNQGFLVSITNENDIQVWNLRNRSLACSLVWDSNITAFSIISGSHFMYVGDEYGSVSVLKFSIDDGQLLRLPYHISLASLAEGAELSLPNNQPIVGVLPQPFSSGNRLLIAYDNGLIILWDVIEARILIVKGDKYLQLKDDMIDSSRNSDTSLVDDSSQHQVEEKEISALCWASSDGSILAVGYIDGDILFWKISTAAPTKGQKSGLQNNVIKIQLSSAEKRLPIIVLHWWAKSKSRNGVDGQILIYGGDEIGSDEVLTILSLEWSSGMDTLKCVGRVDLSMSGSFADVILLPSAGTKGTDQNAALFVLTSPGQLKAFECTSLSPTESQEEKKISVSDKDYPAELPIVDPSMTVAKLFQIPEDGNLSDALLEENLFKKFCSVETFSGAKKWALTGGVSNHLTLGNANRIERVYIAGYQDGSVRMWDATHPVLSLLCIFESEVRGQNMTISSASVSKIDFCFKTLRLVVGDECGLVRLYELKDNGGTSFISVDQTKQEVHKFAQCQGPHCRAVIKLLASQIQALNFVNSGAKLTVGYENAQVAVLDMTSLSLSFFTDSISGGISQLVSVIPTAYEHDCSHIKSPKHSELSENYTDEIMFILTKDARIYAIDGGTESDTTVSSSSNHLQSSNNEEVSKEHLLETTAKRSDKSETCSSDDISSRKKNIKNSLVLLCCKDTLRIYATKSVVQGDRKSIHKVKHEKPCCWTATFNMNGKVSGLILLFQTGEIEIRSLPELDLVMATSLMSVLRWNFKANMERTMSSVESGHIAMVNGSEVAFLSLAASENDFRIPESLPSLHDEVLAAAAETAINFALNQKKKQVPGSNLLGNVVKGFKGWKPNHTMDTAFSSESKFDHLEGIFMKNPFPESSPIMQDIQEEPELNIDDIEIDEPTPMASTSSHEVQNTERDKKTERERLFDFEGADTKPRLRTHEEILATYRKAGDASSAAGQARNKLLERQEKLERISKRTEELSSGAEDFASLANELVKAMENRKWWHI
nr:Syntaxin-binding protein 5-like [Ipomoea batatas]